MVLAGAAGVALAALALRKDIALAAAVLPTLSFCRTPVPIEVYTFKTCPGEGEDGAIEVGGTDRRLGCCTRWFGGWLRWGPGQLPTRSCRWAGDSCCRCNAGHVHLTCASDAGI